MGNQLQAVKNERVLAKQPVSAPPVRYATGRDYLGRAIDAAGNLIKPFGSQREDFQTRETAYGRTQTEIEQQDLIEQMKSRIAFQSQEKVRLDGERTAAENRYANLLERVRTYGNDIQIQPTSYSGNRSDENQNRSNLRNEDGSLRVAKANAGNDPRDRGAAGVTEDPAGRGDTEHSNGTTQGAGSNIKGSSDLIWLLPLLLLSLGLNFFLWIHSRSLYLRYGDLADELRSMVGTSTI